MNIMKLLTVTNNMTNSKIAILSLIAVQLNEISGVTAEYRHAVGSSAHALSVDTFDDYDNVAWFRLKSNYDFDAEYTRNNDEHFNYSTHHLITDELDGINNRDVHFDSERFAEIVENCCAHLTDAKIVKHLLKLAYIIINMDSIGDVHYKNILQQHMSVHCRKKEIDDGEITRENIRLLTSIGVTVSYF